MKYYLVDKNLLVPDVIIKSEFFDIIEELYKRVWKREQSYVDNIYVVKYSGIMYDGIIKYIDGKLYEVNGSIQKQINLDYSYLFLSDNVSNDNQTEKNTVAVNVKKVNFDEKINLSETNTKLPEEKTNTPNSILKPVLNQISNIRKRFSTQEKSSIESTQEIKEQNEEIKPINISEPEMELVIKPKSYENIKITDNEIKIESVEKFDEIKQREKVDLESEIKEKKKMELLKMCDQVMDLYNLELNKIKKIELSLRSIDTKIEKMEKKKRDKLFECISRTKNEYETWKKIKYVIPVENPKLLYVNISELEEREDIKVPILFQAKYNCIEQMLQNTHIIKYFETLNNLSLENLYVQDQIDLDEGLLKFVEKYSELSKKDLHYKFGHDWDYLENELGEEQHGLSSFT